MLENKKLEVQVYEASLPLFLPLCLSPKDLINVSHTHVLLRTESCRKWKKIH